MNKNTFTFLLFLIGITVNSQIGRTKTEIIEEYKDYELKKTTDGKTDYIFFKQKYDNFTRRVACYLTNKKEGEEQVCHTSTIIEPSSETNKWVKIFNKNNFIKLKGMRWKDYEESILYDIEVKDGKCFVNKYYDNKY